MQISIKNQAVLPLSGIPLVIYISDILSPVLLGVLMVEFFLVQVHILVSRLHYCVYVVIALDPFRACCKADIGRVISKRMEPCYALIKLL